jgi:hypothetical protein
VTFLRLHAVSEFDPDASCTRRALALPRLFTPTALPTRRDPPFPGFTFPGHVAPLHLPRASTLYSLGELPGVLSTRRARGAKALQSLTRQKSPRSLNRGIPSCDWQPGRVQQTRRLLFWHLPEIDRPPGSAFGPTREGWPVSVLRCVPRFRRMRHCCTQRLRFRGFIPLPVGVAAYRYSPLATPWLSWA